MPIGKDFPLSVILRLKNRSKGELAVAGREFRKFGREISSVGRTLSTRVTLPILAGAAASVKVAMDLDRATRLAAINLSQGLGDDAFQANLEGIKAGVSEIAAAVPQTQREIANAAVEAARSTGELNDALARTRLSAEIATASGEDIVRVMRLLPRVSNAFGTTSIEGMRELADEIQFVSSMVVSGFGELTEGILEAAPAAKDLGVPRAETIAFIATLQDLGLESTKAGRAARSAFAQMAKQRDNLRRFGVDTGEIFTDDGRFKDGILGVIRGLERVIPTSQLQEARRLFREIASESPDLETEAISAQVRARLGVRAGFQDIVQFMEVFGAQGLSILLSNTDRFEEVLRGIMEDSAGTLGVGIRRAMQGEAAEFDLFLNQLQELGVTIARSGLLDVLRDVLEVVGELIAAFKSQPEGVRKAEIKAAILAALAGPSVNILGAIVQGIGSVLGGAALGRGLLRGAGKAAATGGAAAAGGGAVGAAEGGGGLLSRGAGFLRGAGITGLASIAAKGLFDTAFKDFAYQYGFYDDQQGWHWRDPPEQKVRVEFAGLPAGSRVSTEGDSITVDTGEILR